MSRVDRDDSRMEYEVLLSTGVAFGRALLNLLTVKEMISTVIELCSYLSLLMRIKDALIRL